MAENHVLIDDILKNQSERMMNLKKFYPFFALYETSFSQYKEGKYQSLDMGYLTLSLLRFFINENSFNENDVTYEMVEKFLRQILRRDFGLEGIGIPKFPMFLIYSSGMKFFTNTSA